MFSLQFQWRSSEDQALQSKKKNKIKKKQPESFKAKNVSALYTVGRHCLKNLSLVDVVHKFMNSWFYSFQIYIFRFYALNPLLLLKKKASEFFKMFVFLRRKS